MNLEGKKSHELLLVWLLDVSSVLDMDPKKHHTEESEDVTNLESTRDTIKIKFLVKTRDYIQIFEKTNFFYLNTTIECFEVDGHCSSK
jgi:hypothetical protein